MVDCAAVISANPLADPVQPRSINSPMPEQSQRSTGSRKVVHSAHEPLSNWLPRAEAPDPRYANDCVDHQVDAPKPFTEAEVPGSRPIPDRPVLITLNDHGHSDSRTPIFTWSGSAFGSSTNSTGTFHVKHGAPEPGHPLTRDHEGRSRTPKARLLQCSHTPSS
jgi:hypothetical protein